MLCVSPQAPSKGPATHAGKSRTLETLAPSASTATLSTLHFSPFLPHQGKNWRSGLICRNCTTFEKHKLLAWRCISPGATRSNLHSAQSPLKGIGSSRHRCILSKFGSPGKEDAVNLSAPEASVPLKAEQASRKSPKGVSISYYIHLLKHLVLTCTKCPCL